MTLLLPQQMRKTGIDILGEAPWGTHILLFYETKKDLLDSLVTYYRAGLENNEFCVWITADPLTVDHAKQAMRAAVADFDDRLSRGQMEIFHYDQWYVKDGHFDIRRTLDRWISKHDHALAAGYDGCRVSGNTTWIEDKDWRHFVDYEEEINRVIGQFRMIVLCTYSLERCSAMAAMDVIRHHQYALVKQGGMWELVQGSEQKLIESELRKIEWLLRKSVREETPEEKKKGLYGSLMQINESRRILDATGEEVLLDIGREHLVLLDTSAAVFEKNGDYAIRIIQCGWCRCLNEASRRLCTTDNDREALRCGKWLCHESTWSRAACIAIDTGKSVDVECDGGMHVYAVPIIVENETVGAASICYGDPPRDPKKLGHIADQFGVDPVRLAEHAHSYESRPHYVIEIAKSRLRSSARLIGEILRRTEAEHRIRRQKIELEEINRELESFCFSVSHDLRAPLRGIDGFSHALLEEYGDRFDEKGKKFLTFVRSETIHMARLIDDLLSLSRVTRAEMQSEQVDLSAMADSVAASLQRREPDRCVSFTIAPGVTARGDIALLRSVLENLLGNAFKFTSARDKGEIEFGILTGDEAEDWGCSAVYFVKDNGAGFDMDYYDKLFTPFGRLHSASEFPGNGIGLATVNRIIHRHGGTVQARGRVGEGATFYFSLGEDAGRERKKTSAC